MAPKLLLMKRAPLGVFVLSVPPISAAIIFCPDEDDAIDTKRVTSGLCVFAACFSSKVWPANLENQSSVRRFPTLTPVNRSDASRFGMSVCGSRVVFPGCSAEMSAGRFSPGVVASAVIRV